jgi:uncharacterized protein YndB with AHSA1/START domain
VSELRLTTVPDVHTGMLIRRPAAEVCEAFVDPSVITKVWYTHSTGRMTPGATLTWTWEMYDVSTTVSVKQVEPGKRIVFDWNDDPHSTVELRFTPHGEQATHVEVTESTPARTGDEVCAHLAGSTAGFAFVLSALKALLEHGIVLTTVLDAHPGKPPS